MMLAGVGVHDSDFQQIQGGQQMTSDIGFYIPSAQGNRD